MRVKIDKNKNFDAVFGADSFRAHWPELMTEQGVEVRKLQDWWYIWDHAEQWIAHDTAFFTWEDIKHMAIIRNRDAHGRFVKEIA